jgi:hypothetical protein
MATYANGTPSCAFDVPSAGRIAWLAGPASEVFAVIKNVPQEA